MVVDDEPKVCRLLEKVLGEEGYHVVTATSGKRALALALAIRPDVVVLDVVMPGIDGVATLRELRKQGHGSPVVMLTARANVWTAREAMMLGAIEYITKPFNLEFFKSVLREGVRACQEGRRDSACAQ